MRESHPIEQAVGIDYYVSDADGIGGQLRTEPDDFQVTEIENFDPEPVDADPGAYPEILLRATLRKWDTNDFAGRISDAMGISRERVAWAGTKDKHAVTTQLFSIRDVDPEAVDALDVNGAEIEVLGRTGRSISFGDLHGNRFVIRVRDADSDAPERTKETTAALREFVDSLDSGGTEGTAGVPNWFGQQRFGSQRPVTHEVGLNIVRREWREAVLSYVANPFETEREGTQSARQFVADEAASDDPDWQACLDQIPGYLGYERSMLHRLIEDGAETPADFRNALEAVPWNLQRLFVNAAQSYLFNQILSERLRRGIPFDRPVEGDVCCFVDREAPDGLYAPDTDRLQNVSGKRVDVMERHCSRGRAFVTAPLIGTETELAEGEPGEIEREILDELDLDPADFDLPGSFESTGTRRAILVRTDLDVDPDELTFEFALPSGSYATALMREYLKRGPLDL
ncbi:tRNA pseudouridine13 synthase [Halohasta litchfieldiae]|uniref:Probable tRNA pseudouridine synthase D n=1 Tax=Halohasta litchfieldiae TaxID=1073996 RepID=A0A1H6S7A1_9EURY|nr:tRNA pseudouridine(13) synthase TruD [Halohasta litchfieldiae]ATW87900.1 tRNA pseudouridine13 synthase [Halohasta litchfieldiae]SEI62636.1 tRNA pseudouridine13 synthase [Halohasta litchfieldiae]